MGRYPNRCNVRNCDGIIKVVYHHIHPNGDKSRRRECTKCDWTQTTVEIDRRKYARMRKLLICLQNGVKEYVEK